MLRSGVVNSEYLSAFPVLRKVVDISRITPVARERLIILFTFTLTLTSNFLQKINKLFLRFV